MKDYIFLMHDDTPPSADAGGAEDWMRYIGTLQAAGCFAGGSAIGGGACFSKSAAPAKAITSLDGFLRVRATDLSAARKLLAGNPAFEAGATVEIRELPPD